MGVEYMFCKVWFHVFLWVLLYVQYIVFWKMYLFVPYRICESFSFSSMIMLWANTRLRILFLNTFGQCSSLWAPLRSARWWGIGLLQLNYCGWLWLVCGQVAAQGNINLWLSPECAGRRVNRYLIKFKTSPLFIMYNTLYMGHNEGFTTQPVS